MAYAKKPAAKKATKAKAKAKAKADKPFVPFWAMKKGAKAKGKK